MLLQNCSTVNYPCVYMMQRVKDAIRNATAKMQYIQLSLCVYDAKG